MAEVFLYKFVGFATGAVTSASIPESNSTQPGRSRSGWLLACLVLVLALICLATFASAQESPSSFDDVVSRAAAARDQNDIPTAIQLYGQAVQLKPEWPDGWWFLGVMQYGTGAYPAAKDALTHFIALSPDSGPALALRGLCEFETADYQQSLRDIQQGLALGAANKSRNEEILRLHEALLLTLNGDFEEALRAYAFFSHDGMNDPEMLMGVGLAGLRTPLLPRDVDVGQRDLFVAAGAAALHFMAGDEEKSQQEFQSLFQRFPTAANAHYLYGYLLFAKDPDRAVLEFKRELEVVPANATAHMMLAWYFLLQNDSSEALGYAQKAVAEAPASPSAQLALGRALVETGEVNSGTEHLETALKLDPGNLEVHLALVRAYSKSGRKEDARRERQQCLEATKGEASTIAHP